jgi:hypothetical protein
MAYVFNLSFVICHLSHLSQVSDVHRSQTEWDICIYSLCTQPHLHLHLHNSHSIPTYTPDSILLIMCTHILLMRACVYSFSLFSRHPTVVSSLLFSLLKLLFLINFSLHYFSYLLFITCIHCQYAPKGCPVATGYEPR